MPNVIKPTALKLLQGNPGRRPLPENEPMPDVTAPSPPDYLSDESAAVWNSIVGQLASLRIMTDLDIMALALMCDAEVEYQTAKREIEKSGHIVVSPNGYDMPSPWLSIRNKANDKVLKILTEFGMTPSSRTKVQVPKKPSDDPLGKMIDRKKK